MEWLKNLSNAIDYIEKNLDGLICYEEAAKIACCSTYYLGRMFSYVAGISLSEYIRRRRMTQAAFEIQTTDTKVLEVALKYGYTSPTSFNRAFHNVHGISPILAKAKGSILNAYPPIKFSVNIIGGNVMPYRVEEKEAMRIVGIRIPLTMDMEDNKRNVPPFWESTLKSKQFATICNLSDRLPMRVLGATVCQSDDEIYYYIAAATNQPVPDGMFEYQIPNATWVVFEVIIMCIVSLFFSVNIATGFTGILLVAILVFLTAFFISGLTYAISLCLPNEVLYETVMNAIVLPIFFLSTALFPADGLSGGLKIAVNLNPFTLVINVLRDLILQDDIVYRDVSFVVVLLIGMCGISFSWANHRLKKETAL